MNLIWIIYWILVVLNIILGILTIINKNKVTGIIQIILSIIAPIFSFIFCLKRDFINQTELEFLFKQLISGRVDAILIVLLFLLLICISVYNLFKLIKNKKKE